MSKYIKKKHLKNAVEELEWHHINCDGKLVSGASDIDEALVKYKDVKKMVKSLPTIEGDAWVDALIQGIEQFEKEGWQ